MGDANQSTKPQTYDEIMWTCGQCGCRITSEADRVHGETIGVFHRACRTIGAGRVYSAEVIINGR